MSDILYIKKLSITDFMQRRGYRWERSHDKNAAYLSPFRSESNPSFVVNKHRNTWTDFGDSDESTNHGDIISLVMRLDNVTFPEALAILEDKTYNPVSIFHEPIEKKKSIRVEKVSNLTSKDLIEYITLTRGIKWEIADMYCKEVAYSFPSGTHPESIYTAIGFQNDLGAFELRNPVMKLSTDPKCFTTIDGDDTECNLFEGFVDALSYLEYHNLTKFKEKTYVLNGTGMIHILLPFLKGKVNVYADNDNAGNDLLNIIKESGLEYVDQRVKFEYYNDYNNKLTAK